jgi:two-component system NtrC family response regulator
MVRRFAPAVGIDPPDVSEDAFAQLETHPWPGNVRELENVVKRTLAALDGSAIRHFEIGDEDGSRLDDGPMDHLLRKHGGNLSQVARAVGVSRPTLYRRLQQLGLDPEQYRDSWRRGCDATRRLATAIVADA